MAEYAGYVSPESRVDFAKAFGGLAQKISDVGTNIKKERESLDALQRDNETIVNSYEPGKSQTLNEMVIRGASDIKSQMKGWNDELKAGRLRPDEYKRRMENVKEYWGTLANSAKTFDQRYEQTMARQQPDENGNIPASAFEMELLNRFGQMADISNNSVQVGTDGRLYMVKKDADGKIVGDIMDIRTMNSPDNIMQNRIDVSSAVNSIVENWDPWSIWSDAGKGGELNIEDVRENKAVFGPMKAQVAETIAPDNNPRAQISVLVDNGVIDADYYLTNDEYNQIRQEKINEALQVKKTAGLPQELTDQEIKRIEFGLVKLEKDQKGIINPVLTEEQRKAAKDRVMQDVEIQLARKVTGTPKRTYKEGGGSGSGKEEKAVDASLYTKMANAWQSGDMTTLDSLLKNRNYRMKQVKGVGTSVVQIDEYGNEIEIHPPTKNLRDLTPYFFGTGADAIKKAEAQIKAYNSGRSSGGGTNSSSSDPLGLGI